MSEQVASTEQDRLQRLRGLLSGQRAQDRAGRALAMGQGVHGNTLLGVLLHGADRLRQGQTPTDLEQILLDAARAQLSDPETRAWGGVYREAVTAQGGKVPVLPEKITRLRVTQGYSMADLRRDLPSLQAEALAAPNVQIVSPAAVAEGRPEDPAFIAAMAQTGFAVTAFGDVTEPLAAGAAEAAGAGQGEEAPADSGESPDGSSASTTFRVKLEMENFYVHRAVGDQGGGRDEIYWTAATGVGDRELGRTFTSEEFGAVKKGDTRSFNAARKVFFDGPSRGFVGTTICCWEADQSNAQWFSELQKALNKAIDSIDYYLMFADILTGFSMPTWATIAWEIGKSFATFMHLFRNYDDLSCVRTIGLDRQDLAVLAHRGQTVWNFNGDGHHELRVKYTGDQVPFPVRTLEYAMRTGNSWSAPVALPWKSITPPALASYNGKLYVAFVRDDYAVMWSRLENGMWRKPERIGQDQSNFAPALCAFRGELFYAVTGRNEGLYWRTYTERDDWSSITQWNGYRSGYAPSMATIPSRLWLTHVDPEGRLYHNTHDGNGWSGSHQSNLDWRVKGAAAMGAHGTGQVWRLGCGTDDKVHFMISGSPTGWRDDVGKADWSTRRGLALTVHEGELWAFRQGTDGILRAGTCTVSSSWRNAAQVGAKPITSMDEPAAASHAGKLYVMYRR
ncbi:hypothetical protein AB0F24_25835 [Streptomyces platensis]|uniref:hypothetical protein n=1 Tax=Streptomyces platensis TaxID=58346 RepID=UPI0033DC31FF